MTESTTPAAPAAPAAPPPPSNIQALQALYDAARSANLPAAAHEQLRTFGLQLAKFIEVSEKAGADQAPILPFPSQE